jgi:hypothetical protein
MFLTVYQSIRGSFRKQLNHNKGLLEPFEDEAQAALF